MLRLFRHLRAAVRRRRLDAELREEMAQHVEWKAQSYAALGVPEAEARRRAAIDVGNLTRLREDARAMWGFPTLDSIGQDLGYGVRLWRRSPAFTLVAVLSLAVGIGASAAVFSLADAFLFRKLPVTNPDELVVVRWTSGPVFPFSSLNGYADQNGGGLMSTSVSKAAYETFRQEARRVADIIAFDDLYQVNIAVGGTPDTGTAHEVSGNFFQVLGVNAALGRALLPGDDSPDAPPTIVISHAFWQRRFGGDPGAIGRTVTINARQFTVAGVLPPAFHGAGQPGTNPDLYLPLAQHHLIAPDDAVTDPNYWWIVTMGRLKPGVSVPDARAALDMLLKRTTAAAKPALATRDLPRIQLLPGSRGQVESREQMGRTLTMMAAVTLIVLLVACANVANLLLARGRARVRELSVRVAIGAPRARVVRQLFTEALLLAAVGSAIGVLFAHWIGSALLPAITFDELTMTTTAALNWRVVAFAVGAATASALIFGLIPAFRCTDVQLASGLEETRRGTTAGRRRRVLSGALIAVQIALSLMLVAAAGLLVRSLRHLESVPLGFDAHNLLLFQVDPSAAGYSSERAAQTITTILQRVRALPGVTAASMSNHRLMSNSSSITSARRPEEAAPAPGTAESTAFQHTHGALQLTVDGDFFSTLRIPMVAGRTFADGDVGGQPSAVINRLLAMRLFDTTDVLGREFRLGSQQKGIPAYRIVGVVADARYASIRRGFEPTAYLFDRQAPSGTAEATFEVRTEGAPSALAPTVRDIIRQLDSTLPVSRVGTQLEQIDLSIRTERLFARLATLLGLVALALSGIGLYGLLAYSVTQRTPEIGIRVALGAEQTAVRWLVLRESMALAALGLIAGVPAALAGTRILESLLFELPSRDPLTLAGASGFMVLLALLAAYLPARRAARVDPMIALRAE